MNTLLNQPFVILGPPNDCSIMTLRPEKAVSLLHLLLSTLEPHPLDQEWRWQPLPGLRPPWGSQPFHHWKTWFPYEHPGPVKAWLRVRLLCAETWTRTGWDDALVHWVNDDYVVHKIWRRWKILDFSLTSHGHANHTKYGRDRHIYWLYLGVMRSLHMHCSI